MKVLHVSPYFAPAYRYGGPPASILGLCQGLARAGVQSEVLTTVANGAEELGADVAEREEFEGVAVSYLPLGFPRRLFRPRGFGSVFRERVRAAHLVHLHGLWNWPVWVAAHQCRRAGLPYIVSPRGMLDGGSLAHHRWRKALGYRVWEKRYLRRAALLHATSAEEKRNVERLGLGPEVVEVPNGVERPRVTRRTDWRRDLELGPDAELILFLGRIHPTKRIDLLLSAVEKLRYRAPGARLVLAGPRDGLEPRALLARTSAGGWANWVGPVTADRKWSLLAEASALVLCSESESFGMSVVEAMAVGTPVVVTRTCPWEEVQIEGAGFWVPPTPDAIASALEKILRDPCEARSMGSNGQRLVEQKYRWCVVARRLADVYARVLSRVRS